MNPSQTMLQLSEIAARIKEMREIMGWSMEELAEKTEFSLADCFAYEGGQTDIPFSFIHSKMRAIPGEKPSISTPTISAGLNILGREASTHPLRIRHTPTTSCSSDTMLKLKRVSPNVSIQRAGAYNTFVCRMA